MNRPLRAIIPGVAAAIVAACGPSGRDAPPKRSAATAVQPAQVPAARDTVPPADTAAVRDPSDTIAALVVDTAATVPRYERVGVVSVLHLPLAMSAALDSVARGFQPYTRGAYSAEILTWMDRDRRGKPISTVIGDFDHDGLLDVALVGADGLLVIRGSTTGASAACIASCDRDRAPRRRSSRGMDMYLNLETAGVHRFGGIEDTTSSAITLEGDGIELVFGEKASMLYYLAGGRWRSIITGD